MIYNNFIVLRFLIRCGMKALKSKLARHILRDPESARVLREATMQAGYGPENGVVVTVRPVRADDQPGESICVNVYYVYKPD